jgi:hypothetical protein
MEKSVTIVVQSPRGTATFTFEKTAKVSDVIEAGRLKFGFDPGTFVLRRENTGETLAPERPLVSYHVEDHERFLLVPEMGSGV